MYIYNYRNLLVLQLNADRVEEGAFKITAVFHHLVAKKIHVISKTLSESVNPLSDPC